MITVAEIGAGVDATVNAVRKAHYAHALAAVRHEYSGRIAAIGEPEAAAYLAVHTKPNPEALKPIDVSGSR